MSGPLRRTGRTIWRQLPFSLWLVALWMMLWGQFTILAAVTGVIVAVFVTRVFRLPPAELSGRINVWYLFVFAALFLGARSEEHTSELQSRENLVCRLLLEKKN